MFDDTTGEWVPWDSCCFCCLLLERCFWFVMLLKPWFRSTQDCPSCFCCGVVALVFNSSPFSWFFSLLSRGCFRSFCTIPPSFRILFDNAKGEWDWLHCCCCCCCCSLETLSSFVSLIHKSSSFGENCACCFNSLSILDQFSSLCVRSSFSWFFGFLVIGEECGCLLGEYFLLPFGVPRSFFGVPHECCCCWYGSWLFNSTLVFTSSFLVL